MISQFKILPRNWVLTKIEDVCINPQYGYTTKASKYGDLKLLRTTDITSGKIDWEKVPYCTKNPDDIEKYLLNDGDIVISRAGSVGFSYLIQTPEKAIFASYLIRFKPLIKKRYFKYFLNSPFYWNSISEKKLGIAVPNVNANKLKSIIIPLPPFNEQNRIVEKIEELFSDLDKATKELKKTQEQLKIYRQAVLEVAFGSTLEKNIFKIKTIEEIITEKQIGLVKSNKEQNSASIGVPYIKMNNINTLGDVDINDNIVYVNVNNEELDKYKLKKNDLLINTRNSFELVGKSGIVKDDNVDRVFNNNILRLRFKNSIIPKFVNYQLLSNEIRQQIRREKKATTNVCALYQRDILPLKFKVPKINIQNDIVNDIEYKLSVCDGLMETVKQSLEKIEYLRQSILKKTFKGKLVQQDPNDESTEKLLERIKQEKEKFELNKKKRK
jgi:type I restriction enzyme S subunit